jgi:hypothetical protein
VPVASAIQKARFMGPSEGSWMRREAQSDSR